MKLINPTLLPRKNYVWGTMTHEESTYRLYYIYAEKDWVDVIGLIYPNSKGGFFVVLWRNSGWDTVCDPVETSEEAMNIVERVHMVYPADISEWKSLYNFCTDYKISKETLLEEQK